MSELPWPITKQPITSIRSFCTSNSSADFYCIRSKIFHKKWPKYDFPFFNAVDLRSHELALKVSAVQDGIDAIKIHCNLSYTKLQPAVYKLLPYSHPHLCIWICHSIYILHTLCLSVSLSLWHIVLPKAIEVCMNGMQWEAKYIWSNLERVGFELIARTRGQHAVWVD